MPARKRTKIEQPASAGAQDRESQGGIAETPVPTNPPEEAETLPQSPAGNVDQKPKSESKPTQSTTSWYGGTWPRTNKTTPVTQVAKKSISVAGNAASKIATDVVATARASSPRPPSISSPLRSPASYLSRGAASSTRSLPLAAAPTKLNITSSSSDTQTENAADGLRRQSNTVSKTRQQGNGEVKDESLTKSVGQSEGTAPEPPATLYSQRPPEGVEATTQPVSWLNWFAKADNVGTKDSGRPQSMAPPTPEASPPSPIQRRNSEPNPSSAPAAESEAHRSWLGIWNTTPKGTQKATVGATATNIGDSVTIDKQTPKKKTSNVPDTAQTSAGIAEAAKSQSYGWAFWSSDDSKSVSGKGRRSSNVGQLALAGSPSQSKPENAVIDEIKGVPDRVSKRPRPQSMQDEGDIPKTAGAKAVPKEDAKGALVAATSNNAKVPATKAKKEAPNLVLPSFKSTYRSTSRPHLIQQLSRLFQLSSSSEPKHLGISSPRKVTRALAIGVHGYFPAPLIRSVLGQPTGTSIRFANSAASAIQKWCQTQGYSCEIEKVALEGEGKIAERVDLLWKLLLNWIDKIRKADFVMIACHSQGVPVAMMLVEKLIAFGCVNSARIGVCAMAGVNVGPFIDYKSRWIGGSAAELFEFCVPDSQVSKDYEAALDVALRFGVRIVYIGSIDDQLVSLEVRDPRLPLQKQRAKCRYSLQLSVHYHTPTSTAPSLLMAASTLQTSSLISSGSRSSSATWASPITI